ncbi:MAG TPA: DUF2071 domain-containing protein [Thermoanaerobaculia bacterium]|nr:DUF2071 domain-containing protein [Thermoanaerobaculia bacterium]
MLYRRNPLTMVATIDRCWWLTYHTPAPVAARFVPSPLELVTHNGFAFWNIVVARLRSMRPKGIPEPLGIDYWHIGYRLLVRLHTGAEQLEGLHFVRSECDRMLLTMAGNLLTDFRFHTAQIDVAESGDHVFVRVGSAQGAGTQADFVRGAQAPLPSDSAFGSLAEAEARLRYTPRAISVRNGVANILDVARDESQWRTSPVTIEHARWRFFGDVEARPELAFEIAPMEYQWNRGRDVPVTGKAPTY